MIENHGTTPAEQDSTTTEPIIDQLIATRITELEASNADLEAKLAEMTTAKDSWYKSWSDLTVDIRRAEAEFKDVLEGDTDAEDIIKAYGPALSQLGWEFTREVEIEVTVTYRGTIELPVGKDVDDLDASDFSVESYIGHDYYSADLTHWNSDVEER